ncbi:hypothetical protein GJ698_01890 [Pseudoduganella sp. FT26W]|uniref:Uncharacterized protein n=1 Tax=Duganella aquatilis TaxID=2666082 RepID=A0A844D2E4_9BURK|nr:hypothetical protein [Duganella aquatilis]MRW82842.1 hypothetical protein [Duganella aquatilis]
MKLPVGKDQSQYATGAADADLYVIEARAVGSQDWYSFSLVPAPASENAADVKRLNASDCTTVYRSVLVKAAA